MEVPEVCPDSECGWNPGVTADWLSALSGGMKRGALDVVESNSEYSIFMVHT